MSSIVHLNDGEGRPVCNSFMHEEFQVTDWTNEEQMNCAACREIIFHASVKLAMMQSIARDISNIQKQLSEKRDPQLMALKRKMENEERGYHPQNVNEAYIMAQLVSDQALARKNNFVK